MSGGHYHTRAAFKQRKAYASRGDDATLSRWVKVFVPLDEQLRLLRTHKHDAPRLLRRPAIVAGRSLFHRKGIKPADHTTNFFVSAHSNAKIGRDVRKGLFKGYWIYTLSLEERATCPTSCHHWATCYGNNMPYATRIDTSDEFLFLREAQRQLDILMNPGPGAKRTGVLIRLHALGDFFSPLYVDFWYKNLKKYPNLAAYGYTARKPSHSDPIGLKIWAVRQNFKERFSIRWSDGGQGGNCTVSIQDPDELPADAFQCPEQFPGFTAKGKPILCATCGLCWSTTKNVAFLEH